MEVGFCSSRRCAFYSAYRFLTSRADAVPHTTPYIIYVGGGTPYRGNFSVGISRRVLLSSRCRLGEMWVPDYSGL